jgi:hypothetical protein
VYAELLPYNPKRKHHLGDEDADGRVILKYILENHI